MEIMWIKISKKEKKAILYCLVKCINIININKNCKQNSKDNFMMNK